MRRFTLHLTRANDADRRHTPSLATGEYHRHLPDGRVATLSLDVSALRERVQAIDRAEHPLGLGRDLRAALLKSGWAQVEGQIQAALAEGPAELLIQLNADELAPLPWEALPLGNNGVALALTEGLRVLHLEPGFEPLSWALGPPARVLLAWSSAGGAVPSERLEQDLGALLGERLLTLPDATPGTIDQTLRLQPPIEALVLLAHGARAGELTGLSLERGKPATTASPLVEVLRASLPNLRLILLLACRSGDQPAHAPGFGTLASELHRAGALCVVASRWDLSAAGATTLAKELFTRWSGVSSLGDAVSGALGALPKDLDRLGLQVLGLSSATSEPGVEHIPLPIHTFIGREAELAALAGALLGTTVRTATVCNPQGMPGVGKTWLVEAFWREHGARFPGGLARVVLSEHSIPSPETLLSAFIDHLGLHQAQGGPAQRLLSHGRSRRALLWVDNVDRDEDARAVAELADALRGLPLVLTGRYRFTAFTRWCIVPVEPLSEADALRQLDAELDPQVGLTVSGADRSTLVRALGGLPLALRLAAGYVNVGYRAGEFLDELRRLGLNLEPINAGDRLYADRALRALNATFDLSMRALAAELGAEGEDAVRALAALAVAPLVGVGRGLMEAVLGESGARAIRWISATVKLSILSPVEGRAHAWRMHKLLGEALRAKHPDVQPGAMERLDGWFLERLPGEPTETRGARWQEMREESKGLAEWLGGLNGARALRPCQSGVSFALSNGPYGVWLGAIAVAIAGFPERHARIDLLRAWGGIAWMAGELALMEQSVVTKAELDLGRDEQREHALATGLPANNLPAGGQVGESPRSIREESMALYVQLSEVHEQILRMGKITDILQERGQFDGTLRRLREEALPFYAQLGEVREQAVTVGQIADIRRARGQLDEALCRPRKESLPISEQLELCGDLLVCRATLAILLMRTYNPAHVLEALGLARASLQATLELLELCYPEANPTGETVHKFGLPPPE